MHFSNDKNIEICPGNALAPYRRQAIIWTNIDTNLWHFVVGCLLHIGPVWFREILSSSRFDMVHCLIVVLWEMSILIYGLVHPVVMTDWHHAPIASLTNQRSSLSRSPEEVAIFLIIALPLQWRTIFERAEISEKMRWQPDSQWTMMQLHMQVVY